LHLDLAFLTPIYKVLDAEICFGGDTQQPAAAAAVSASQAARSQPIKIPPIHQSIPPSVSVLYSVVNKEVEQQFSRRGVTL
jgi:hypothetical protein